MMSKFLYILDVAHGKDVPGKQSPDGRLKEWLWSRMFLQALHDLLTENNIDSVIPVTQDTEPGLTNRCNLYNSIPGNKIMISAHNNAAGMGTEWMTARGFEIWTSPGQTRSDQIADIFGKHIKNDNPLLPFRSDFSDGDLDKEAKFTVLTGTHFPAILIENLFQDNRDDVALLMDKSFNGCLLQTYLKSILEVEQTL